MCVKMSQRFFDSLLLGSTSEGLTAVRRVQYPDLRSDTLIERLVDYYRGNSRLQKHHWGESICVSDCEVNDRHSACDVQRQTGSPQSHCRPKEFFEDLNLHGAISPIKGCRNNMHRFVVSTFSLLLVGVARWVTKSDQSQDRFYHRLHRFSFIFST